MPNAQLLNDWFGKSIDEDVYCHVLAVEVGKRINRKLAMTNNTKTDKLEAKLVASPAGLAALSDAVEMALTSPEGRASVEISTPDGKRFTLHIVRQIDDVVELEQEYG